MALPFPAVMLLLVSYNDRVEGGLTETLPERLLYEPFQVHSQS